VGAPSFDGLAFDASAFDGNSFDDVDGAYAVAEPDPFAEPVATPFTRPSLRVELGGAPARPFTQLARPSLPPLPIRSELASILPDGLRRGRTIAVTSSVSLLLALLSEASKAGAWIALVGMPTISADAATEAGIDLQRLAIIGSATAGESASRSWTTAVGALLDAVDIVVARPGINQSTDGEARRLTARARSKDACLMLFGQLSTHWPAVEVTLSAQHGQWTGIGEGYGRLTARKLIVSATGKGRSARMRTGELWL